MRPIVFILFLTIILAACATQPSPPAEATPELPTPELRVSSAPTPTRTRESTRAPATAIISTLEANAEDLNGVEIDFWHVWSWESGQALEDLVNEFNITNPYGIRVNTKNQENFSDLSSELESAWRTAEGPNLTVGFTNQLQAWDMEWSNVRDLNDFVFDPEWGISADDQDDYYPTIWSQDLAGDKRLGLPAQRSAQLLFYNQTWAEELGLDAPPETVAEFRNHGCKAANANREDEDSSNDGTGGWVIDTSTGTVFTWIQSFGGEIVNSSGYSFNNETVSDTLAFFKDMFDDGCGWLSQTRYPNPEFASRRALFISSSTAGIPFQETAFEDTGSSDKWKSIAFPSTDADSTGVIGLFGPSFALFESSPEEELATWLALRWLLEPENQARWIQASGHLPSRRAALAELQDYIEQHPQWAEAVDMIPLAEIEPQHASWGAVRWALSDAAEQVFRLGLTTDQLPALLEELELTAEELHARFR